MPPNSGRRSSLRPVQRPCYHPELVQAPGLVLFHARTPFNREYTSYREDVAADLAYLGRKWQPAS